MKQKIGAIILVSLLNCLLLPVAGGGAAASQAKLGQVVYITLSKACGCVLERCQAGDNIVGNVFNGARQKLPKRVDYSTDRDTAKTYIKKYRVTQAPALLFLDAQGNLLWMRAGELDEKEVADKLSQFDG